MSLRIWLPLNGNARNQGASGPSTTTVTGATVNNSGKIGKCYSFNGSNNYIVGSHSFITNNTKNWSFCCWVNFTNNVSNTQCLFSCRSSAASTGITIFAFSGTNWLIDDGTRWTFTPKTSFAVNTWYHICVTRNNSGKKLYVNGVLDTSTTSVGTLSNASTTNYMIGASQNGATSPSGNYLYGDLNDVRFYDHDLSVKEIKEISKGLVLHFPLDCNGVGIPNMVSDSATFSGWSIGSGWTKGVSDDGSTMYSFSRTGATGNNWVRIIPTLKIDGNNYPNGITVSMDLLTPDKSAINQTCLGALQQYDANGSRTGWCEPGWSLANVVNGEWSRISYSFTKAQLLTNSQGLTYSYTMFSFQLVQNGNISIRKIKIEDGNKATEYTLSPSDGGAGSIEVDTSGFINNGTRSGTLSAGSDSAKFKSSTKFSNNSHIVVPINNAGVANSYTFSWWGKYTNYSGHMMWGFSNGNRLNLYMSSGNFYWNTGDGNGNAFGVSAATYGDDKWHHFAVTGNGSVAKLYIDGVFKANAATYKGITGTSLVFNGWATSADYNFNGSLSDFRLYATALSDDDIKQLYNTAASISKNGSVLCYDFNEQ